MSRKRTYRSNTLPFLAFNGRSRISKLAFSAEACSTNLRPGAKKEAKEKLQHLGFPRGPHRSTD